MAELNVKSLTVDNLGPGVSIDYAKRLQQYDKKIGEDAQIIPLEGGVSTSQPYAQSSFDEFFSLPKQIPFASFSPPPEASDPAGLFFKNGLLPQDFYDIRDALADKLAQFRETLSTLPSSAIEEFQKIEGGIDIKEKLTRTWELIKSRCNQFQRG